MVKRAGRVLLVEDEESIGQGLCDVLAFRGHKVTWAKTGGEALRMASETPHDLVLLDVMLPEVDGFTVCERLRAGGNRGGIILLTAKGSEEDILRGFEAGADDYVTKPFSLRLLLARVDAVLLRSLPDIQSPFVAGNIAVEPAIGSAQGPRGKVELSLREMGILRILGEEPGRIVSRRVLLRDVWEMTNPEGVETRTVDVHMGKLRKKLADVSHDTVEAVRGQGYRYVLGERN